MSLAVWRGAETDITPLRTMGGPARIRRGDVTITGPGRVTWKTPFHPMRGVDYTDREFILDVFEHDPEAWALGVTCPCGEALAGDDAGDLLREIYKHCGAAGHPKPIFER